jgi:pimeloyl-ACP methyl ester carboxylesterase
MEWFESHDGTRLAYRVTGSGPVLVCLPGGPGQASDYLGDLGGLPSRRTLVLLENRGVWPSETPADLETLRVDRLVEDVEALRRHLDMERLDLLGHSAGGGVAMLYAAAHDDRLDRLILANPSLRVVGLPSDVGAGRIAAERSREGWYGEALPAYQAWNDAETYDEAWTYWLPSAPLSYGRWTAAARAHAAATQAQFFPIPRKGFYAGFEPEPQVVDRLAAFQAPVLIVGGEHDLWPTRFALDALAPLFPSAGLSVQAGAGHFPWVDDATAFAQRVGAFLA